MTIKRICMIFLLLTASVCYCRAQTNNIRPAFELKLYVNDTTFFDAPMKETLYIPKDGVLQIFPHDTLFVEADTLKDSLVNLKVVKEVKNKGKTLRIVFLQDVENKTHKQMILSVVNPFAKKLVYSAQINLMKRKQWVKTSIMPVLPGLVSFETWPDIITTAVLYDFCLKE